METLFLYSRKYLSTAGFDCQSKNQRAVGLGFIDLTLLQQYYRVAIVPERISCFSNLGETSLLPHSLGSVFLNGGEIFLGIDSRWKTRPSLKAVYEIVRYQ